MKRKACVKVGKSFDVDLPKKVSEADLVKQVHELKMPILMYMVG